MFGVGFCFLAVMYVLSTDVVVERNEKKSDDVRYGTSLETTCTLHLLGH